MLLASVAGFELQLMPLAVVPLTPTANVPPVTPLKVNSAELGYSSV